MIRKYKILDKYGVPARVLVSFEDGTTVQIDELSSVAAAADISNSLMLQNINHRIEAIRW